MNFAEWLNKQLEGINLEEIAAFNFNLYEEDEETSFSAQLVGCPSFDEDSDDWACDTVFSSGEDLFTFQSDDWESALTDFIQTLNGYFQSCPNNVLLKSNKHIAVGFVDGDLEIVV